MISTRYADLGNLLKRWRAERFAGVSELYAERPLSFPQDTYVRYENGEELAPPEALSEIAEAFGHDVREALLVWAGCQVTSVEHKAFFSAEATSYGSPANLARVDAQKEAKVQSNKIPASQLEQAWVFGTYEQEHLARYPWLLDFLIGLATAYPDPIPFESYGFAGNEEREIFIEKYLKTWLNNGALVLDEKGIRLSRPHFHIPKAPEWQTVRATMLSRQIEALIPMMTPELLSIQKSHRMVLHKRLTEEQYRYWLAKLAALELEISLAAGADASHPDVQARTYSFLLLWAPRELGLPDHITRTRVQFPKKAA